MLTHPCPSSRCQRRLIAARRPHRIRLCRSGPCVKMHCPTCIIFASLAASTRELWEGLATLVATVATAVLSDFQHCCRAGSRSVQSRASTNVLLIAFCSYCREWWLLMTLEEQSVVGSAEGRRNSCTKLLKCQWLYVFFSAVI